MSLIDPVDAVLGRTQAMLKDFLGEQSRKYRTGLLVSAICGIAVAKAGLVPKEINALGIKLEITQQQYLLGIAAVVNVYFLVGFVIRASHDYVAFLMSLPGTLQVIDHRKQHAEQELDKCAIERTTDESERVVSVVRMQLANAYHKFASMLLFGKVVLDLLFPIAVGLYSCYALCQLAFK